MSISIENLGFGLYPEETRDDSELFALSSPFRMLNGSPFDVFVEKVGTSFHIFDDGLTMHEIVSCGINMSSHHRWAALRKIASMRNVNLSRSGVFEVYTSFTNAETAVANYLRTMFAIDDWLTEHAFESRAKKNLVEESKKLFKRWWPTKELVDRPKIAGISGMQLEFDFKIDDKYVDAITPTANASAGFLRKVLAIPENIRNSVQTIAVIDDRLSKEAANREKNILTSHANIILISNLEKNAMQSDLIA